MKPQHRTLYKMAPLLFLACAQFALAGGLESLENFVGTVKTARAEFTQIVTLPARQGQPQRSKTSSGTFEFARPNRFRFHYLKPFEQTIVADGQTLWLHDVELNQVTARKQQAALAGTPAALIAVAPDLSALHDNFSLQAAPEQEGLQWVQATPKSRDGQIQSVRVGFRGNELAVLEILDSLGQRSVMRFGRVLTNVPMATNAFFFQPPSGAELIRQ
jgi:outer membrane lipoprotein carrier protein